MKDKTTKILVIIAVILAIVYYFRDSIMKIFTPKEDKSEDSPENDIINTPVQDVSSSDWNAYKKIGDKGNTVQSIQKYVNSSIYWAKKTSLFGVSNDERIKQVRAIVPLSEDGVFGNKTAAAVFILVGKNTTSRKEMFEKANDFKVVAQNSTSGTGGTW